MLEVRGRQELRLAKGAGPRGLHVGNARMAALDHQQSRDHLGAEHLLARRHEGFGAEHLERIVRDSRRAETALAPPDGEEDAAGNAIAGFEVA